MKNNVQFISDPLVMKDWDAVKAFNDAYPEDGLKKVVIATASREGAITADTTAVIAIRLFIQTGEHARRGQKYVAFLSFSRFGDMATVDIISLDRDMHKDIVAEHLGRVDSELGAELRKKKDILKMAYQVPFLIAGGHLRMDPDMRVMFFGMFGDFGNTLCFADSNAVASEVATICGLDVMSIDGLTFIPTLLEFMLKRKLQKDFYERFTDLMLEKGTHPIPGQMIGGMMAMKAIDRAEDEGKDINDILVEEVSEGYGKYFLAASIARMT